MYFDAPISTAGARWEETRAKALILQREFPQARALEPPGRALVIDSSYWWRPAPQGIGAAGCGPAELPVRMTSVFRVSNGKRRRSQSTCRPRHGAPCWAT